MDIHIVSAHIVWIFFQCLLLCLILVIVVFSFYNEKPLLCFNETTLFLHVFGAVLVSCKLIQAKQAPPMIFKRASQIVTLQSDT